MNRFLFLLALFVALTTAACDDTMPSAPTTPQDSVDITATTWRLVSVERGGTINAIDAGTVILLRFDATTFVGLGPCHRHTGAYAVNGAAMTISGLSAGDGPCDKADLQARYLQDLRGVGGYLAGDSLLKLYSAGGSVVLTYSRSNATIDTVPRNVEVRGKTWRLVKMVSGGLVDTLQEAPWVTLTMTSRASGAGPCNPYEAALAIDSVNIRFTDVQAGVANCARAERERRYIEALKLAKTYQSTERTLRIDFVGGSLYYMPLDTNHLAGTKWLLQSVVLRAGAEVVPNGRITLAFAEKTLEGMGLCNRYTASYALAPTNRLSISGFSSTETACADTFEQTYFEMLPTAVEYALTGDRLTIFTPSAMLFYKPL